MSLIISCSLSALCFQTSGGRGGGETYPKDAQFKWQGKHQSFVILLANPTPLPCPRPLLHVLHCHTYARPIVMVCDHLLLSPYKAKHLFLSFQYSFAQKKKPYTHTTYGSCHMSCPLQLLQMQLHFLGTAYCTAETYQHPKVHIQDLGHWKSFGIPKAFLGLIQDMTPEI